MPLEAATYISGLNASNPVGVSDPKSQGDDHLRLIKSTLLNTFPNITGAVNASHTELNRLVGVTGVTGSGALVLGTGPTITNLTLAGALAGTPAWASAQNFPNASTIGDLQGLNGEARLIDSSGFFSVYNGANTVRSGYLQMLDTGGIILASEITHGVMTLSTVGASSGISLVHNTVERINVSTRTAIIGNSEIYALSLRYNAAGGFIYLGASNSASPDGYISNNAGSVIAAFYNNRNVEIPGGSLVVAGNIDWGDSTQGRLTFSGSDSYWDSDADIILRPGSVENARITSTGIVAKAANSSETTGALTSASRNRRVPCSGNITLPSAGMTEGDVIFIDPKGTARTITRPAAHTMYVNDVDSATATTSAHNVCAAVYHGGSKWTLQGAVL